MQLLYYIFKILKNQSHLLAQDFSCNFYKIYRLITPVFTVSSTKKPLKVKKVMLRNPLIDLSYKVRIDSLL